MKELNNEIHIDASAERVWRILTDFASFAQWNPFMKQVSGAPTLGTRLQVTAQPSGAQRYRSSATISTVESQRELRWRTHMIVPGLLDSERVFTIEPLNTSTVRFTQREVFTGLFSSLRGEGRNAASRRGLREMNLALKQRAEAIPPTK